MEKTEKVQAVLPRKKIAIIGVAALFVCVAVLIVFLVTRGGELEARIMEIFSVDGPDVSLTRGAEATVAASAGARLHDGYGVLTGEDSICHIRLDTDSLVRMDTRSRISVYQVTATTLSILVEDGQVLIDVQNQYSGHELEVLVGNAALGVRGTLFIAGFGGADEAHVIMLEGSVYVDGEEPVSAGYVMMLPDDEPQEVSPLRVENLDIFAMQAILDYQERVLEAGAITEEELEWIIRRMSVPDYIWIQGVQISTALTELFLTSDTIYLYYRNVSDSAGVFEIVATDEDIVSLEYMLNLRRLELANQQITDLEPFSNLIDLALLSITSVIWDYGPTLSSEGQISDISPLSGLTNIRSLEIEGNQISDITPLATLVNLHGLHLRQNNISDISSFAELTSLRSLSLCLNDITDISPLAELVDLQVLHLSSNHVSDLSPLAGLTNLDTLVVWGNPITDWSPVSHVENVLGRP